MERCLLCAGSELVPAGYRMVRHWRAGVELLGVPVAGAVVRLGGPPSTSELYLPSQGRSACLEVR